MRTASRARMGRVQLFVSPGEEPLAHRQHGLLVGRVGQLVHLAVGCAVGDVAVIAADLFDCRVSKEPVELIPDPAYVLDEPLDRGGRVCEGLKIILASHGCELEHLYLVLDQLTDFYGVKDRALRRR